MRVISHLRGMTQHTTNESAHTRLIRSNPKNRVLRGVLAEWDAVTMNRRAVRRANGWGLPGDPVVSLDEMVRRAGFSQPKQCDESDTYLLALVKVAAEDPLAARIVLQRVLPPLIGIARRRGNRVGGGVDAAISDLLTQAWFVITSYPAERRPRKIAANIVRDIEYFEYVAHNRPRKTSVQFVEHEHFTVAESPLAMSAAHPGPDDAVRIFMLELERRGVNPVRTEILKLSLDGWRSAEIGERLGLKERTTRWHRAAALTAAREIMADAKPDDDRSCGSAA